MDKNASQPKRMSEKMGSKYKKYPVFVLCGSDPSRRKLLRVLDPEEQYKSKALLPFLGKRVIDWQLEALRDSPYVEDLYLIGLSKEDIAFDFPVRYVPSKTTAYVHQKLMDGLSYLDSLGKSPELVIISTSDTPGIRTQHINEFFEQLNHYQNYDFVLSVVPEESIQEIFPRSGRVVGRFTDHQVFPGELFALSKHAIQTGYDVIDQLTKLRRVVDRKRKKISLGPILRYLARKPKTWFFILKFLLKKASLEDGEKMFSVAFNCKAKAIIISDPGFGMDMDLPEDYERLQPLVRTTKMNAKEA